MPEHAVGGACQCMPCACFWRCMSVHYEGLQVNMMKPAVRAHDSSSDCCLTSVHCEPHQRRRLEEMEKRHLTIG